VRARNICERCCLRPVKEVHHLTYANLGHEPLHELLGLCAECHAWISDTYGAKRPATDPAPAWAASYGAVLRAYGLLDSADPVADRAFERRLPEWQAALPDSTGAMLLEYYHIPLAVAQQMGLGFVHAYDWPGSRAKGDVLVFPETNPEGRVVSLLGRHLSPGKGNSSPWSVIGPEQVVQRTSQDGQPVAIRQRQRGYVGASALAQSGPVLITNDPFEMLALRAAGAEQVLSLANASWRWTWSFLPQRFFFTFDLATHDPDGTGRWADFGTEAEVVCKQIFRRGDGPSLSQAWRSDDRRPLDDLIAAAR
jgi:hypothetical protein